MLVVRGSPCWFSDHCNCIRLALVLGSSAARGPGGVYTCDGSQIDALCAQEAVESRAWPRVSRSLAGSSWPHQGSLSGKRHSTSVIASTTETPPPGLPSVTISLCLPSPSPAPHALPWLRALSHQPCRWVGPGHCPVLLSSLLSPGSQLRTRPGCW